MPRHASLGFFIGFLALSIILAAPTGATSQAVDEVEQIVKRMAEEDEKEILKSAEELESLGLAAIPEIKKGLKSDEELVVAGCAKALWELGEKKKAKEALVEIVSAEEDLRAGLFACEILASKADSDMEDEIQELLDEVKNLRLKVGVCRVLARTGAKPDARRELERLLKSDDAKVQMESALLLGELEYLASSREAMAVLKKLSEDPSPEGRLARALLDKDELLRVLAERDSRSKKREKSELNIELLDEVWRSIKERYVDEEKVDREKLLHEALRGMVSSLDPYSTFLTKDDRGKLEEQIELEYAGIGASVSMRDGWLTVESPIIGGAAYDAGIRSFDRIIDVEGESTYGKNLEDLVKKLRGKPGTEVRIKVSSARWTSVQEFVLVRRVINLPVVRTDMLPGNIGYLQLTTFSRDCGDKVEEALDQLEEDGMKALVFDLRYNSGGYLQASVDVASNFLDKGDLVLYTKGRPPLFPRQDYPVERARSHADVPVIVLANNGSASASEIVAGALQDHEKAMLVGTKTFGKGSVQHIYPLETSKGECALRLTVMKYYLPEGRCIHEKGIEPDFSVEPKELDGWELAERSKLDKTRAVWNYVTENYEKNKELFKELAASDRNDESLYPGFDAFYASLGTLLSRDRVRQFVRANIRKMIFDDTGKELVTDVQEDIQLQAGVVEVLKKLSVDPETIPEYKGIAGAVEEHVKKEKSETAEGSTETGGDGEKKEEGEEGVY